MKHDAHVQHYKHFMIANLIEKLYGRKVKRISFNFH